MQAKVPWPLKQESVNPQSNPHLVLSSKTSAFLGSARGVCKSLKNLMVVPCHGRGRGFEPRRPRHTFQMSSLEWAETIGGAKGHRFVSLLPFCALFYREFPPGSHPPCPQRLCREDFL